MNLPAIEPDRIPRLKREFLLRIWAFYKPYALHLTGTLLVIIINVAFTVAQPLILRDLIDQAASGTDFTKMATVASLLIILPVLAATLNVIQQQLTGTVSANMQFDLRNFVYKHLQFLPYRMYVHAPPGEINARLSGDVQQTSQIVLQTIPEGSSNLIRIGATLVIMFTLEWRLSLAALLILPLLGWFARRRNYIARKISLNNMQANAALGLQVGETTSPGGVMSVRLFDRVSLELQRYRLLAENVRKIEKNQNKLQAGNVLLGSTMAAIGTAVVYAAGGLLVFQDSFSIGTLIAFVAYLGGLYPSMQSLLRLPSNLATALVSYERIFELLDLPQEPQSAVHTELPARARGELTFEQVNFQFDDTVPLRETARPWSLNLMGQSGKSPETTPEQTIALENISFSVRPGQMVAIVGPSGAGKSTIFNLIPRFYDPQEGQIKLDGNDLRDLPTEWIRRQVALVSQGVYVAPGTLGDNLRYAKPQASDDELRTALELANLADWAESLPYGLETFLGQSGARLSGGERQRLAIARALLKDTPLLLLDEATSHLDSLNEGLLQEALFRIRQDRATLVIAHRLSTVHDADEILVLNGGQIVERGKHQNLLAQNGLYARLYEKQFIHSDKE